MTRPGPDVASAVEPAPTGQPQPVRRPRARAGGQGRARPGVEEDVPDVPIAEDGQGRVQGVSLANGPEVDLDPPRGRPALGSKPRHLEAPPVTADAEEGRERPRAGSPSPPSRGPRPKVVDVKGAARLGLDGGREAQDLGRLDADTEGAARLEAPDPADLARRVESAEEPLEAVDLAEGRPGRLPGVILFPAGDEDFSKNVAIASWANLSMGPLEPGACRVDLLRSLWPEGQLADEIRTDLDAGGDVLLAVDLLVGQELDVEQDVGVAARPEVIHLGKRQAPALEPRLELLALAPAAQEIDDHPDGAGRIDLAAVARVIK